MSRFIEAACDEQLTVSEAAKRLTALRKGDDGFLTEAAAVLIGLYNNPELLKQVLLAGLRSSAGVNPFYTPQSFLLCNGRFAGDSETFTLRGNVWFPQAWTGANQSLEDHVYSYGNCHDHNFDFLTVGYLGPGYETDIYEYDHDATLGVIGEQVDVRFLQHATLSPGRVLHFRKSKDIHVQRYPERTSVSINLLLPGADLLVRPQYQFDLESNRISGVLYSASMLDTSITHLAGQLECVEVMPSLRDGMLDSPMWRHRHAVLQAMIESGVISPSEAVAEAALHLPPAVASRFADAGAGAGSTF